MQIKNGITHCRLTSEAPRAYLMVANNRMRNSRSQRRMRFWKNCILLILFVVFLQYWLKIKSYLFDEKTIVEIGKRNSVILGKNAPVEQFKRIVNDLKQHYPGHILPEGSRSWVMIKSGGWVGSLSILYASMTEYLVFCGTAVDSQGHSGRHWMNLTSVLLTGSVSEWREGTLQAITHRPGDAITLKWGTANSAVWKANTWSLEYGRGFIPFSLPYTIADSLFSSFDLIGIFKLFKSFAQAYYFELKGEIANFIASI